MNRKILAKELLKIAKRIFSAGEHGALLKSAYKVEGKEIQCDYETMYFPDEGWDDLVKDVEKYKKGFLEDIQKIKKISLVKSVIISKTSKKIDMYIEKNDERIHFNMLFSVFVENEKDVGVVKGKLEKIGYNIDDVDW